MKLFLYYTRHQFDFTDESFVTNWSHLTTTNMKSLPVTWGRFSTLGWRYPRGPSCSKGATPWLTQKVLIVPCLSISVLMIFTVLRCYLSSCERTAWKGIGTKQRSVIGHFRKYHNTLCLSPQFCIRIVFVFSWDHCKSQGNWNQCLCKICGGQTKSIMVFSEVA